MVKKSKTGEITEETTILGIPCMTLRTNTKQPEMVAIGPHELIGTNLRALETEMKKLISDHGQKDSTPPLCDGKITYRNIEILIK